MIESLTLSWVMFSWLLKKSYDPGKFLHKTFNHRLEQFLCTFLNKRNKFNTKILWSIRWPLKSKLEIKKEALSFVLLEPTHTFPCFNCMLFVGSCCTNIILLIQGFYTFLLVINLLKKNKTGFITHDKVQPKTLLFLHAISFEWITQL